MSLGLLALELRRDALTAARAEAVAASKSAVVLEVDRGGRRRLLLLLISLVVEELVWVWDDGMRRSARRFKRAVWRSECILSLCLVDGECYIEVRYRDLLYYGCAISFR